jgi:hypothetical protein
VSTRVTELHRWHSRSVLLVMRHRTNWCQSPNTLYDSLHRRDICPQAPNPTLWPVSQWQQCARLAYYPQNISLGFARFWQRFFTKH